MIHPWHDVTPGDKLPGEIQRRDRDPLRLVRRVRTRQNQRPELERVRLIERFRAWQKTGLLGLSLFVPGSRWPQQQDQQARQTDTGVDIGRRGSVVFPRYGGEHPNI
jgi:hypothetical protein